MKSSSYSQEKSW